MEIAGLIILDSDELPRNGPVGAKLRIAQWWCTLYTVQKFAQAGLYFRIGFGSRILLMT